MVDFSTLKERFVGLFNRQSTRMNSPAPDTSYALVLKLDTENLLAFRVRLNDWAQAQQNPPAITNYTHRHSTLKLVTEFQVVTCNRSALKSLKAAFPEITEAVPLTEKTIQQKTLDKKRNSIRKYY